MPSSDFQDSDYKPNPYGGLIQSPDLKDGDGKPKRAVKDIGQARDMTKTIIAAGQQRQIVNARILAKVNSERPYNQAQLENEGLGWRQNFSTKVLPSLIEKVAPRFCEAIQNLKYVTDSKLSDKWENSTEKTEKFREVITSTIRSRKGWKTLLEDLAFDDTTFGHSVAAVLDEFTWFPKVFTQAENFLPDGCKQQASLAQFIVLKEVFLPHELFALIKDRDTAKELGWNLKNTATAINEASPAQLRDMLNAGGTTETWYQNAIRELTLGASYIAGASVITVYTLLVCECDGKVSHYRLAGTELLDIFSKEDRFDSMESCLSFFAFERGNGTMAGSKGIGRQLYELCGMIERCRNEIVDRSIMSGKIIVQGDVKRIHTFKMSVIGATCIIPENWQVLERKLDGNVEPFLKLDAYLGLIADGLVGNTSPRTFGGERTTAAEVNLFASREDESKDVRIVRFLEQFVCMVGMMQRRICDADTLEDDAKAAQKLLLEHMTRKELDELAKSPVAATVMDLTPMERQGVAVFCAEKRGNPLYNQRSLEVEDGTARVGSDFVNRVLLPTNDPTETAENTRQQQLELLALMQGQPVPVSPRDNHLVHLQILMPIAEQTAAAMMQGQADTALFENLVQHITEHANAARAQGAPKEELKPILDFVKKSGPIIAQLKTQDAEAEQLGAQSQQHDADSQQIMAAAGPPPPQ